MKEIIEWHKCSDGEPEEEKSYLVCRDARNYIRFSSWYPLVGRWGGSHIIAWAEMPKGYKEE